MPRKAFSQKAVRLPERVQVQTERERLRRRDERLTKALRRFFLAVLSAVLILLIWSMLYVSLP